MSPDASDEYWDSFLKQVPHAEFDSGMAVEGMSHKPQDFSEVFS